MKKLLIASVAAFAFSASAQTTSYQQCSEVVRPDGSIVLACKNVPAPAPVRDSTPVPKPVPVNPLVEPVGSPAVIAPSAATEGAEPLPKPIIPVAVPAVSKKDLYSAVAQAATLQVLQPSAAGKSTLNLQAASYEGYAAFGLTFAHKLSNSATINAGYSNGASGKGMVKVGAGFEF